MTLLKFSTFCSGIGSPEQALKELQIPHEVVFACERDKYAKQTYLANHSCNQMFEDMTTMDMSQDGIYSDCVVGGIPCQSFSLAGKRLGELDPRGLLFYNFYDYIKKQQPKFFIIENVKGLLSTENVFETWLELLGQSVNTHYNMFNHEDSLLYNLHWAVLNSKDFGVPQNRERVFIIGIRNDLPNNFRFPTGFPLTKRLKDILEPVVDEKYYLSDKMLECLNNNTARNIDKKNGFKTNFKDGNDIGNTVRANYFKMTGDMDYIREKSLFSNSGVGRKREKRDTVPPLRSHDGCGHDNFLVEPLCVAQRGRNPINPSDRTTGTHTEQRLEPNSQGITNTITSVQKDNLIIVKEATKKGFDTAEEGDSINMSNPNSFTRRGRVGKGVANTLDTACNQAVVVPETILKNRIRRLTPLECFRLQGFPDEFFQKSKYASKAQFEQLLIQIPQLKGKKCLLNNEEVSEIMSDSQLYKQAGNSITTFVIGAILKNLLT